jgi:hypothetical protein
MFKNLRLLQPAKGELDNILGHLQDNDQYTADEVQLMNDIHNQVKVTRFLGYTVYELKVNVHYRYPFHISGKYCSDKYQLNCIWLIVTVDLGIERIVCQSASMVQGATTALCSHKLALPSIYPTSIRVGNTTIHEAEV